MPDLTPRVGIKKPLGTENVTRQSFNENWDIIDAKVATVGADGRVPLAQMSVTTLATKTEVNASVTAINAAHTQHVRDYVTHPAYVTASGTGNVITANLPVAPGSYVDGMGVVLKATANNTGSVTINLNSMGAKTIRKPNGDTLIDGNIRTGGIYSLRYNATSGNFILAGEGGGFTNAERASLIANINGIINQ